MTIQYVAIRVLVASPDDVAEERAIVEELIDEHNRNSGRARGFIFESVMWEKDAVPGFGDHAQDVFNAQVADDYDLFIGIFWKRLGTPTSRARSGSEEEFDRAYARYKTNPDSVRIMCYFADRPIIYNNEDPRQLALVAAFRKKVSDLGGLYDTYQDLDTFRSKLRPHLSAIAREHESRSASPHAGTVSPQPPTSPNPQPDDDPGFLDLLESGTESLNTANAATTRLGTAIERMGAAVAAQGRELKTAPSDKPAEWKRIVNRAADALLTFVEEADKVLPEFGPPLQKGMDDIGRAAIIAKEMNPNDTSSIRSALTSIETLRDTIRGTQPQMQSLGASIAGIPRATTDLNKARARAQQTMQTIDLQMSNAAQTADAVHTLLTTLLD